MSEGEIVVLVVCVGLSLALWLPSLVRVATVRRLASPLSVRLPVLAAPLAGAATLLAVLRTLAAQDVRYDVSYLSFYFVMGAAWVGVGARLMPYFGLSARDDVVERGNPAAAWAIAGAILALTLAFAGANIGDGPGWWVVVFSAALSTAGLAALWFVLARFARAADAVVIDRDTAAGVRAAGFLVAQGLILGSAVAGDWVSAGATVADFARAAWPALPVLAVALVLEALLRPTADQPRRPVVLCGAIPALLYVVLATAAVSLFNDWAQSAGAF